MHLFNRHPIWLAALLVSGCVSTSPQPQPGRDGCPSWRWLAVKAPTQDACPSLHEDGNTRTGTSSSPFCFYQGTDGSLGQEIQRLQSEGKLVRAKEDCAVVGSLGNPNPSSLPMQSWKTLEEFFGAQVGKGTLPAPADNGQPSVRLAILDTQPNLAWREQAEGNSPHGWSVAHIARHLVCDGEPLGSPSCVAEVSTELALPWWKYNPHNPPHQFLNLRDGGYFGTIYDLAKAIDRELQRAGSSRNLVLSVSVGWDGRKFGGLEPEVDDMPVPAEILYRVLKEAACRGALVIAAAGNRLGPDSHSDLLLPAAWADRKVTCPDGSKPSLLYAVGGVDRDGRPLSNARTNGMPELAAFADHAVVGTPRPTSGKLKGHKSGRQSAMTKTYTGSSVAAAVASAIAAAVWSQEPDWSAREVIQTLYDSGCGVHEWADLVSTPPLGNPTRVASSALPTHGGSDSYEVRRVHLQRALLQASGQSPVECPGSEPPELTLALQGSNLTANPPRPHDHKMTESILGRPWTGPQPQDPPCPNCTLEPPPTGGGGGEGLTLLGEFSATTEEPSTYTLFIEIDSDWPQTSPLENATLRFGEGPTALVMPLEVGVLRSGDRAMVEGIDAILVNGADPIVLEFTVYDDSVEKMVENPVLVAR